MIRNDIWRVIMNEKDENWWKNRTTENAYKTKVKLGSLILCTETATSKQGLLYRACAKTKDFGKAI